MGRVPELPHEGVPRVHARGLLVDAEVAHATGPAGAPEGIVCGGVVELDLVEALDRAHQVAVRPYEGLHGPEPAVLALGGVQGGVARQRGAGERGPAGDVEQARERGSGDVDREDGLLAAVLPAVDGRPLRTRDLDGASSDDEREPERVRPCLAGRGGPPLPDEREALRSRALHVHAGDAELGVCAQVEVDPERQRAVLQVVGEPHPQLPLSVLP